MNSGAQKLVIRPGSRRFSTRMRTRSPLSVPEALGYRSFVMATGGRRHSGPELDLSRDPGA